MPGRIPIAAQSLIPKEVDGATLSPVVTLDLVRATKHLSALLRDLLERRPALVQLLNLNTDLLRSLGLAHGRQLVGNGVQLRQASLVGLQVLKSRSRIQK